MSLLLALDASTPRTALALGVVDREEGSARMLAGYVAEDGANQASTWLIDQVHALCHKAHVELREVAAIACGQGPGTFTGTRVALATAKGLALGVGASCVPLSTLAAVAGGAPPSPRIVALLDARRGEVYAGAFARIGERIERIADDRCATIEEVLKDMADPTCLFGPGVQAMSDRIPEALRDRAHASPGVDADGLWRAAASAALTGAWVPARALDAVYLRGSYAELGIHQPKRPMVRSPFV